MAKIELSGHYGYRRLGITLMPMVAMMIVTSVYTIVDGFFVSNFVGSNAFAAMNIIWPACNVISVFGVMIGAGGSALVSKILGEGDQLKAGKVFTSLIRLCIIIGIITGVLLFVFMDALALLLGAEGELLEPAVIYGRILVCVMPATMLQLAFNSFYMVAEKPQLGTIMSIASGLANIFFDFAFIVLLDWGLAGAAAGTAASMLLGGFFPFFWFKSRRNRTHLRYISGRFDWKAIVKACTNGLSEYVGNISFSIVTMCYNLQLMKYIGANGVSAYGIIMYVAFIFGAVFIGFNMGVSQIISFNYGAGNKLELRSLLKKSLVITGVGGVLMCLLAELTAPLLSKTFVGYDEELTQITVHALSIYMLSIILCGVNMFTSAWFTALNNGIISALAAFSRTMVFELGSILILPGIFGLDGIWSSVIVAEVFAFLMCISLILGFRKRYLY